jgi:3-oxoacyl-[acyl-carrier-protein] synthase II
MPIYIEAHALISGQEDPRRPQTLGADTVAAAVDPDFERHIPKRSLRRMDRMSRYGLYVAGECLAADPEPPIDGVIVGVGQTFAENPAKMLTDIVRNDEGLINPTSFMNSLLSTAAGQMALHWQCSGYTNTYTQRGFSFESALLDASVRLDERPTERYLVAGIDIFNEDYLELATTYGHIGSVASSVGRQIGEGASGFLVSGRPSSRSRAQVTAIETLFLGAEPSYAGAALQRFQGEQGLPQPDLVVSGQPRNQEAAAAYAALWSVLPADLPRLDYKIWSGEYPTAAGFGTWVATAILNGELATDATTPSPERILVINSYGERYFSFLYLQNP